MIKLSKTLFEKTIKCYNYCQLIRRVYIGIFIAFAIFQYASAQNWRINAYTGYGFYQLKELRDFQYDLRGYAMGLPVESVIKFPGNFTYNVSVEYSKNNKNYFGIDIGLYNTGARNHIKDYSGEYKLDMLLNGYQFGLLYRNLLPIAAKLHVYVLAKSGVLLSRLEIKEFFVINNFENHTYNYKFNSIMFFIEPSFGFSWSISPKISASFGLGYNLNFNSKLSKKGDSDLKLNYSGENVHVNWSGVRFIAGIGYNLK